MKIAVTYENGQIFQHFDHTEQFKVYKENVCYPFSFDTAMVYKNQTKEE